MVDSTVQALADCSRLRLTRASISSWAGDSGCWAFRIFPEGDSRHSLFRAEVELGTLFVHDGFGASWRVRGHGGQGCETASAWGKGERKV